MKKEQTSKPKSLSRQAGRRKSVVLAEKKSRPTKRVMIESTADIDSIDDALEQGDMSMTTGKPNRWFLVIAVVVLLLGFGGYKYRYLLVPATVNGQPIYIWSYLSAMHKQFGADQLNAMTTELMIEQAVAKANISVPSEELDREIALVEQEASSSGGLAAVLEAQRMSMEEFKTRLRLQLAVKKILADKIVITEQEINETYAKGKDFYKGVPEAQAKAEVKKQLEEQKFQQEVSTWLAEVRTNSTVDIKFPGL